MIKDETRTYGKYETRLIGSPNCIQSRLREILDTRGWSQSRLARELKMSTVEVNKIYLGRIYPSLRTLVIMADVLEVPVGWFFE